MRAAVQCASLLAILCLITNTPCFADGPRAAAGVAGAAKKQDSFWTRLLRLPSNAWQAVRKRVGRPDRHDDAVRPALAEQRERDNGTLRRGIGRWFQRLFRPFKRTEPPPPAIHDTGPMLLDFDDPPVDEPAGELRLPPLSVPTPRRDR